MPRPRWFWPGLALLLLLACWLYLRGYNVSLPFIEHPDEPHHLLAAQHTIDFGHARGVFHEAYPPGMKTLIYLFLKHLKPVDAHHGTMLPALRLLTISVWMLIIVMIALLGSMIAHPLTGLMAAAIWIVNHWVVEQAHWALPNAYVTFFTLLALWLALAACIQGRRSFSTVAVYSIMLAIVFKTQAAFVAPIVLFMPMLQWRRAPAQRKELWQQTLLNCLRFGIFLFWLLLIYPTLEVDTIVYFPASYSSIALPSLESAWGSLRNVLGPFGLLQDWPLVVLCCGLLWRYRQRVNGVALFAIILAGAAWLLGMSMFRVQSARHYFAVGAIVAMLYACGLTGLLFVGQEALSRLRLPFLPALLRLALVPCAVLILMAARLQYSYNKADDIAHNFTLHDRRNDLMLYMDTSLEPGMYISNYDNHKTFNRAWGGYTGFHDFKWHPQDVLLSEKPIEHWRELGAEYGIVPHSLALADPSITYPGETVILKTYPVSDEFRGPDMVVLRLYPMQYQHGGKLGPIHLLGYDLSATAAQAGGNITLRHYWRAESAPASTLHVFNHLLDGAGEIVAQVDGIPLFDSRRDSTAWDDPEETLLGRNFILGLPEELPPANYTLISGFYDPATGQRLHANNGADFIEITEILVPPAP